MEAHTCNHPLVPHTVQYHIGNGKPEIASVVRPFEHLEDAEIFAQKIIRQTSDRLSWLKVFRSDNESYVCFRWDNPKREKNVDENNKVILEVDMEPLKEAFENVALGFKNQGAAIRKLWIAQGVMGSALIIDILSRLLR